MGCDIYPSVWFSFVTYPKYRRGQRPKTFTVTLKFLTTCLMLPYVCVSVCHIYVTYMYDNIKPTHTCMHSYASIWMQICIYSCLHTTLTHTYAKIVLHSHTQTCNKYTQNNPIHICLCVCMCVFFKKNW